MSKEKERLEDISTLVTEGIEAMLDNDEDYFELEKDIKRNGCLVGGAAWII